ncbi:hypothetical protein THAOC_28563, partial [Thalassiosira oceanica]
MTYSTMSRGTKMSMSEFMGDSKPGGFPSGPRSRALTKLFPAFPFRKQNFPILRSEGDDGSFRRNDDREPSRADADSGWRRGGGGGGDRYGDSRGGGGYNDRGGDRYGDSRGGGGYNDRGGD